MHDQCEYQPPHRWHHQHIGGTTMLQLNTGGTTVAASSRLLNILAAIRRDIAARGARSSNQLTLMAP